MSRVPFFPVSRFCSVLILFAAIGCEEERPAVEGLVPVTGTVTLDGKPLENAQVTFVPMSVDLHGGLDANAQTDAEGKYELQSDQGRAVGAKPGKYRVVISRLHRPDGTIALLSPDKSPMQLMIEDQAKESIPARYSDSLKTVLRAEVPAGGGTQDFRLSAK